MESRLRPRPPIGDRGKACGIYQIHARHSYPMFRRKRGYVGWDEKDPKNRRTIRRECGKLRTTRYTVDTLSRLLDIFDDKELPPCHHNSGIYGKCNSWYAERPDFWVGYFTVAQYLCKEEVMTAMAYDENRNTLLLQHSTEKTQGYLDSWGAKRARRKKMRFICQHNLAEKVKKGEETAPVWAT